MNITAKCSMIIRIGTSGRHSAVMELKELWREFGYFTGQVDPTNQVRREEVSMTVKLPSAGKAFSQYHVKEFDLPLEIITASPRLIDLVEYLNRPETKVVQE